MVMQSSNKFVRHGDVDIRPIESTSLKTIPKEAKISGREVMHGESGHRHMLQSGQVLIMDDPIEIETLAGTKQVEKFLHIPQDTVITHEEHLTRPIKPGDYVVLQEREMDHLTEAERSVVD